MVGRWLFSSSFLGDLSSPVSLRFPSTLWSTACVGHPFSFLSLVSLLPFITLFHISFPARFNLPPPSGTCFSFPLFFFSFFFFFFFSFFVFITSLPANLFSWCCSQIGYRVVVALTCGVFFFFFFSLCCLTQIEHVMSLLFSSHEVCSCRSGETPVFKIIPFFPVSFFKPFSFFYGECLHPSWLTSIWLVVPPSLPYFFFTCMSIYCLITFFLGQPFFFLF